MNQYAVKPRSRGSGIQEMYGPTQLQCDEHYLETNLHNNVSVYDYLRVTLTQVAVAMDKWYRKMEKSKIV